MEDALVEKLVRELVSAEPGVRERAADETTDVHRGLRGEDVNALVRVLVAALLAETVASCQEAQLNALCDLKAWHNLDLEQLRPLWGLRGTVQPPHAGYLDELLKE
jgi:hypothetical protein